MMIKTNQTYYVNCTNKNESFNYSRQIIAPTEYKESHDNIKYYIHLKVLEV